MMSCSRQSFSSVAFLAMLTAMYDNVLALIVVDIGCCQPLSYCITGKADAGSRGCEQQGLHLDQQTIG